MDKVLPTCGQLERDLSQKIQKLYREELGHSPQKITCKLFSNQLAIIIDEALTIVEQTLIEAGNENLKIRQINQAINEIIVSKMKTAIEDILSVEVIDIMFDSSIDTRRTAAIATLTQPPLVRNFQAIPKNYNKRVSQVETKSESRIQNLKVKSNNYSNNSEEVEKAEEESEITPP